METTKQGEPIIAFDSLESWEAWLSKSHATSNGLWVKIAKKDSGVDTVIYAEAYETALCYGWIDGQKGPFDGSYWLQRFTPRKPRSKWSKINCVKAEELISSGHMKPAGMKEVERAKADGRWEAAYDGQRKAGVPEDLLAALTENEGAQEFFDTLDSTNRYAILYRIQDAKKPETRARRIEKFVAMLSEGKKIHP